MKRAIAVMFVMAFALSISFAGSITGTLNKHNLSSTGPGATHDTTQVCVFCHTPHQPAGTTQEPLWNKAATGEASYGVYGSTTMDSTPLEVVGAGVASTLCMSCHDGTVAVGNMINGPTVTLTPGGNVDASGFITGDPNVGSDLTNDHPVNMIYADAIDILADWNDPPSTAVLFGGTVQCASCHDVHDDANIPFLVMANTNSALCTDCHVK